MHAMADEDGRLPLIVAVKGGGPAAGNNRADAIADGTITVGTGSKKGMTMHEHPGMARARKIMQSMEEDERIKAMEDAQKYNSAKC